MKKLLCTCVLLGLLVPATSGWAHPAATLDRDDSEGPLDIAGAASRHRRVGDEGGQYVDLELAVYEAWAESTVAGGRNFVSFELEWDGDDGVERCVVVRASDDGSLRATVARNCVYLNDDQLDVAASVERPDEHSVVVRVPRRAVTGGRSTYRWRAVTSFEEQPQGSPCAQPEPHGDGGYGTCADFTRWIEHVPPTARRRGTSPGYRGVRMRP